MRVSKREVSARFVLGHDKEVEIQGKVLPRPLLVSAVKVDVVFDDHLVPLVFVKIVGLRLNTKGIPASDRPSEDVVTFEALPEGLRTAIAGEMSAMLAPYDLGMDESGRVR